MKNKKVLNSILGTLVLNVIAAYIYSWITSINIWAAFVEIYKWLFSLLFIDIKLWQVIVSLLLIFIVFYIYMIIKNKNSKPDLSEIFQFNSGVFKGIHFKWDVIKLSESEIGISHFRPICDCGSELTLKNSFRDMYYNKSKLFCVNCQRIIESDYDDEIYDDALLFFKNKMNKKLESYNDKKVNKNRK